MGRDRIDRREMKDRSRSKVIAKVYVIHEHPLQRPMSINAWS